jgi:hypothetical protein
VDITHDAVPPSTPIKLTSDLITDHRKTRIEPCPDMLKSIYAITQTRGQKANNPVARLLGHCLGFNAASLGSSWLLEAGRREVFVEQGFQAGNPASGRFVAHSISNAKWIKAPAAVEAGEKTVESVARFRAGGGGMNRHG